MELLSAAEAADRLGVSDRQIRRLAAIGDLPARRVGDRWLISADAVRSRSRSAPRAGRPLSARMAWAVLAAVDAAVGDGSAGDPLVSIENRQVRHRVRALLADAPPPERWDQWLRHRARSQRVWVHPGIIDRLAEDDRVHPAGASAIAAAGVGLAGGDRDSFYVHEALLEPVLSDYKARPADEGQIVLNVVSREVPDAVLGEPGEPVRRAAALVDLISSADARERHVATSTLAAASSKLVTIAGRRPTP